MVLLCHQYASNYQQEYHVFPRWRRRTRGSYSKTRWRAGTDQLTRLVAGIPKLMRLAALEIVGIARAQHRRFATDRHLQSPLKNDAALFTLMGQRVFARAGPGLVTLFQQLNGLARKIRADLAVGNTALRYFNKFIGTKKHPVMRLQIVREKLAQT